MTWENLVDTALNVGVFVFIGFLVWLYLRKEPDRGHDEDRRDR